MFGGRFRDQDTAFLDRVGDLIAGGYAEGQAHRLGDGGLGFGGEFAGDHDEGSSKDSPYPNQGDHAQVSLEGSGHPPQVSAGR